MFRRIEYHVPANRSAARKQLYLNHKGAKDTKRGELWFRFKQWRGGLVAARQ
jgi:hypothetical protein